MVFAFDPSPHPAKQAAANRTTTHARKTPRARQGMALNMSGASIRIKRLGKLSPTALPSTTGKKRGAAGSRSCFRRLARDGEMLGCSVEESAGRLRVAAYASRGVRCMRRSLTRARHFGCGPALYRALASIALLACLAGCGESRSPAVVRVGDASISRATVARWAHAIARGAGPAEESRGTVTQRALAFLITAESLRAEAVAQGVAPSDHAVERALEGHKEANGVAEFDAALRATEQTEADVKLKIEAELASSAIRRKALSRAPNVTEAEVRTYYKAHRHQFLNPEERRVELIEDLSSPMAASALVRRIGIGPAFSERALHEVLAPIAAGEHLEADIQRVTRAIFAAPVGVASRPMSLNRLWAVFVVRNVTPASYTPLGKVRRAITARITARHHRVSLAAFTKEFRARWTSRTSCRLGYVIQACAQYRGSWQPQPNAFPGE